MNTLDKQKKALEKTWILIELCQVLKSELRSLRVGLI